MVILVAITFIDLETRIIPDWLNIFGAVVGLIGALIFGSPSILYAFLGAAVGFGIFYGFSWIYWKVTGREGLGGGDIKYMGMIGWFLGPAGVLHTLLISSIAGSVVGISIGLVRGRKEMLLTAIPYGPFLVIGSLIAYFFGERLWLIGIAGN